MSDDLNTITSELFGHERGAFSGATSKRIGLVEFARQGTLIFDELLNLPMHAQNLLLDFVQFGTYRPLGFDGPEPRVAQHGSSPPPTAIWGPRYEAGASARICSIASPRRFWSFLPCVVAAKTSFLSLTPRYGGSTRIARGRCRCRSKGCSCRPRSSGPAMSDSWSTSCCEHANELWFVPRWRPSSISSTSRRVTWNGCWCSRAYGPRYRRSTARPRRIWRLRGRTSSRRAIGFRRAKPSSSNKHPRLRRRGRPRGKRAGHCTNHPSEPYGGPRHSLGRRDSSLSLKCPQRRPPPARYRDGRTTTRLIGRLDSV